MRRGLPTLIASLLVTAALAIWGWSLRAQPQPAPESPPLAARTLPPSGDWGPLRLMAANIRLSEPNDGDNAWTQRREAVVKLFLQYQPELIACQEVSPAQGAYLNKELARWYGYYPRAGVGTETPRPGAGGELLGVLSQTVASLNTLYYRSDRFELVDGEAGLVLPDEPQSNPTENTYFSLSVLKEKGTGRTLLAVDLHLRHGEAFAIKCATRIREKVAAWLKKFPSAGVILLGDMNHDRLSKVYTALLDPPAARSPDAAPSLGKLADAFDYSAKKPRERWGTYHQFTGTALSEWPTDLILFNAALQPAPPDGAAQILHEKISTPGNPTPRWPSDHFFVTATLQWSPSK